MMRIGIKVMAVIWIIFWVGAVASSASLLIEEPVRTLLSQVLYSVLAIPGFIAYWWADQDKKKKQEGNETIDSN